MIEELAVYAILLEVGLPIFEDYQAYLDAAFLKDDTNDLLLDLEWHITDKQETLRIMHCAILDSGIFDYTLFGKILFCKLECIYRQNLFTIQEFGAKMYRMWNLLPSGIEQEEPFWTLCYADDCLSWNDEAQTRALYETAFKYYHHDDD